MINFRYHVVSLTAVFLALAVGLVLGSTVLNGPMLDALNSQVNTLGRDNRQLREQVSFLEEESQRDQDYAAESAPMMLDGRLTDRRILLVVLPTGEEYAEGVAQNLELAGATVTGQVQLLDKFVHPAHRLTELLDLAHQVLPGSVPAAGLPANSDGVETSAALLAAVLLDGDGAEPVPDGDRRSVLSAYTAADYLTVVDDTVSGPAEAIVVVAGLPESDTDADDKNEAMLTAVVQFGQAAPTVVAGAGVSGDGNVVAEVRRDPILSTTIATVDNAATPQGQVATGLVVSDRLARGTVSHHGLGDGAASLLPQLVTPAEATP